MTGRSGDDTAAAASGEKYWAMPGGMTGRAPADAVAAADASDDAASTVCALDAAARVGAAEGAGFEPAVSFLISSRPSGPRRYDNAQRDWNSISASSWTLRITNTRLVRPDRSLSTSPRSKPPVSLALSRPSRTRALSRSVCSRPSHQVPMLDSPL